LHIAGVYGGILRFVGSGVNKWGITVEDGLGSDKFGIYDYGSTGGTGYRLIIDNSGNIGIGTSSPVANDSTSKTLQLGSRLIIQDVIGTQAMFSNNAYYDGTWKYAATATARAMRMGHVDGFSFHTTGSGTAGATLTNWDTTDVKMVILNSGNVGIGTASPTAFSTYNTLTINGAIGGILNLQYNGTDGLRIVEDLSQTYLYGARNVPMTFSTNATERMRITSTGTVQPGANGTQDLGTSSLRWATVYTSDLSLSNGIGDYTIVEGEDDLFLYNNKSNKVYKFMLAEVDPANATPKKST